MAISWMKTEERMRSLWRMPFIIENLNPQMKNQDEGNSTITVPDGVDAELLMKVLGNPEMAALLTSLARTMKVE